MRKPYKVAAVQLANMHDWLDRSRTFVSSEPIREFGSRRIGFRLQFNPGHSFTTCSIKSKSMRHHLKLGNFVICPAEGHAMEALPRTYCLGVSS